MGGDVVPAKEQEEAPKQTSIERFSGSIASQYRIISFRGRPMIAVETNNFSHFQPLTKEMFDKIGYPIMRGQSRGKMGDTFAYLSNVVDDLSENDNLILFGTQEDRLKEGVRPVVWDMRSLAFTGFEPDQTVWRSPYPQWYPSKNPPATQVPFVLSLAGNDMEIYDDIMQSIAPLVMEKKPDGVIWWVGDGANGKSTLMDALYKLFPGQLTGLTVKQLTDGRDTPRLNGHLANIVKESSEGRVDDTEVYKSLGTHEDFPVHKFHSQDTVTINGNLHHIFSGNSIPVFNDKGFSARRRTFIIPFNQRFESDPTFEEKTFTPDMFSQLVAEMCRYAKRIEKQGFRYKFSSTTLAAKESYDTEANNAEEYAANLVREGVVAFDSFLPVRNDYENFCADNGYVPLGVGHMRRAIQNAGFERASVHVDGKVEKKYRLPSFTTADLIPIGGMRVGLFTAQGFQPEEPVETPRFEKPPSEEPRPESKVSPW